MQKILDSLLKIFLFCFVFISQLVFFTNFSKNPFIVQNFISVGAIFGALIILVLWCIKQENHFFRYYKSDLAILIFIIWASFSLVINLFFTDTPLALLNDFNRRGFILITAIFGGYFLARFLCNKADFLQEGKQKNYKNGFLFFLWGVLWLFFAYFRMKGFFDIYGLLMWGAAFYIGFKILKQINLRNILDLLLLASALSAAYGICQSLLYDFLWTFDFSKSLGSIGVSTFGNPNFLASFLLFTLPLSMVFYLSASDKAENIYYFTINLIGCTFVALSQTRSAWIGLFFSFLVLISSKNFRNLLFRNKVKIGVLMASLVVLFLIWPENKTSIDKISDIKIASQSIFKNPKNLTLSANRNALNMAYHQRLMAWTCGIKNLKKHPLLGTGWGSWQLNYAKCQGELLNKYPALEEFKTQSNAAHNLLIEIITQSGVLGFLAYIVFGILVFLNFLRYYRQENDINKKVFFLAVFASCLGFFADSMLNISYQIQKIGSVFSFLVGILASLNLEKKIKISSTKNNLLLGGVLIFFLFFSFKQFNHLLASHYSLRGYLSVKENNYNKADKLFKKSLNFSKENPETQFAELKVLEQLKNYNEMDILLSETLKYFPYYYEFYNLRAGFEAKFNRPKEALSYIKKSLALYPYYKGSFGLILKIFTDFKELRTLENASYLESLNPPLSYQNAFSLVLFQIYFEQADYARARTILLKELARNKFDQNIQEKLALVNAELKIENDLVLKEAQKLTALRKQLIETKSVTPALFANLEKAALDGSLETQMLLAQAYFKKNDYENSRLILQNLYLKYADSLPLNFAFSSLEEATGRKEEAKKYLQNILLLDKDNKLAVKRLKELN